MRPFGTLPMPWPAPWFARISLQGGMGAFFCGSVSGVALAGLAGLAAVAGGAPEATAAATAAAAALGLGGLGAMLFGLDDMAALRRGRQEAADMLRSVDAGLIVLDSAGTCVSTGGKLCELLEMPADWDPTGLDIPAIVAELADRAGLVSRGPAGRPVDAALLRAAEEIQFETPRGRSLSVAISARPRGGWVLTCTDVTGPRDQELTVQRVQRELELSEARARQLVSDAEAAEAARSAYLAAISHEIRTPMNGILGLSEVLAETDLTDDQLEQVTTIRDSCESLLVIINDILDFSQIEAGRMTLECAPFDLRAAIGDVLNLVGVRGRQRGLAVVSDYQAGLPEEFFGDLVRMRQVLINLVGNAVKFTVEGSVVVRVRGRPQGERIALEIAVEDTGIGIASEHLPHIFGEFARVEGTTDRRFEGTGLGLAICKRLVEMMSGEIAVTSQPGVGTTFVLRLELPVGSVEGPRLPAPARSGRAAPGPATRRLQVMLVEDNRTNQLVFTLMLEDEPVDLRIAASGCEAVALFPELLPDLVLMDVCMPDMDGFAATAAIRRLELERGLPRVPVLALTAYSGNEYRDRCLEHDMDDFLPKPLNKSDLIALVRAHGAGAIRRDGDAAAVPVLAAS